MKQKQYSRLVLKVIVIAFILFSLMCILFYFYNNSIFSLNKNSNCTIELSEIKDLNLNDYDREKIIEKYNSMIEDPEGKIWYKLEGHIDNDSKTDVIFVDRKVLKLKISSRFFKMRHGRIFQSHISSIDIDDINNDGCQDVWFYDSGESALEIFFGDGTGKLYHKNKHFIERGFIVFYDIDGDNSLELIQFLTPAKKVKIFQVKVLE